MSENPPESETIRLRLTQLPENTPADAAFYLAGDFNGWRAGDAAYRFTSDEEGMATLMLTFPAGEHFRFKITRGTWETVEVQKDGHCRENRLLDRLAHPDSLDLTIEGWRDLCPCHHTVAGLLELRSVAVPWREQERTLRIYLPPDYYSSQKNYPVLYMQDGQNLFDEATAYGAEWGVDETLEALFQEGATEGVIVVGIDNDGTDRISEYGPWPLVMGQYQGDGLGQAYADFVAFEVKDLVDQAYRTRPEREFTAIAGSSMGGVISLFTGLKHQNIFSRVAALSSSFTDEVMGGEALYSFIREVGKRHNMWLYLDMGDSEEDERIFARHEPVVACLREAGFDPYYAVIKGGQHSETAWRERFAQVFLWLFSENTLAELPARIAQDC